MNLDHKQVLAALNEDEREQLLARSDSAGLRHIGVHLVAVGLTTSLILTTGPWRPLFMLIQGVLIVFLFTLLHETVHRTPFRSNKLNTWAGRMCGFVIFIEPRWFRHFHLTHHRYTNEPDRDPELASPRPATTLQYTLYLSGIPETLARFRQLIRSARSAGDDDFVPASGLTAVVRNARIQIALYAVLLGASIVLGSNQLVWIWVLPFMMGAPFLRGYLLAEHAGCADSPSMFVNTRTVLTNPVVRFVAWNMPYHAEHHAFPAVPFHQLPAFHEHTKAHLQVAEPGYLRFNASYLAQIRTTGIPRPPPTMMG